jgi:hypothetical protein
MSSENAENKNNTSEMLNNTIRTLFDRVIENNNREKRDSESSSSESSCDVNPSNNRKWEIIRNLAESQNHLCQMFLRLMEDEDVDE